jgi:hypothetical protein
LRLPANPGISAKAFGFRVFLFLLSAPSVCFFRLVFAKDFDWAPTHFWVCWARAQNVRFGNLSCRQGIKFWRQVLCVKDVVLGRYCFKGIVWAGLLPRCSASTSGARENLSLAGPCYDF